MGRPMAREDTQKMLPDVGFVRLRTILTLIPVAASTWWAWVAAGKAPKPIKLSPNVTAWRVEDIRDLIARLGARSEETAETGDPKATLKEREAEDDPDA